MSSKTSSLERSASASTDLSKDSFHTVEKVISNNRSCAWLVIRIVQIIVFCFVLGLTIFLLKTTISGDNVWSGYRGASSNDWRGWRGASDNPDWSDWRGDGGVPTNGKLTGTNLSVYVPIFVIIGVASLSLLSSFISLITYCFHRLSIKFVVFWDFLMAVGWIISSIFLGILITDQGAWYVNYWVMDLYKLDLVLGVVAILLFITSGGLGIRLHRRSMKRASSVSSPMRNPTSSFSPQQEDGLAGTAGTPYRTYNNYTLPPPRYRQSGEWESVVLDGKVG